MSHNQVNISGNLTRDPELKRTPKGHPVCEFGLAINEKFGERESVTFVDCECWGRNAERVAGLTKGQELLVMGRLKVDSWNDKQSGAKRSKMKVVTTNVGMPIEEGEKEEKMPLVKQPVATPSLGEAVVDQEVPF